MAALTAVRNTIQQADRVHPDLIYVPVKAATKIWQGSLVVSDAGFAAPGRVATTLLALGRAEITVDNTAGAAGALFVTVRRGAFKWLNAGADPVAQADFFTTVFIVDDQSIGKTNGGATRSAAGKFLGLDTDGGAWVETF
jgi:hypothetical protein